MGSVFYHTTFMGRIAEIPFGTARDGSKTSEFHNIPGASGRHLLFN